MKKGLVIAGTKSGCGKTTISLGMMAALARKGLRVAPFKVGPDFIDPGHHSKITGVTSRNLDGWMLSKAYNMECFQHHTQSADIAVVEGVMGLFDGYDGKSEAGSTAQMAKWIGLPVLLIVDAKSMARSAAAVTQGFERFDKDLRFAGVLFNNVGSQRHLEYLKEAIEGHVEMPCLGGIVHDDDISIPERHLGLVTQHDHPLPEQTVSRLADIICKSINLDALLENLKPESRDSQISTPKPRTSSPSPRIGVARDNAFCFYYQDNLELLEAAGAELVTFSPIRDRALPGHLDGIYLGGGYPELFVAELTDNENLRKQIREQSQAGMPIYGECGGFMYLCREIHDKEGLVYPMTGCFPFTTNMSPRLRALGYREITLAKDTLLGTRGQTIRGHEFHYSEITKDTQNQRIATVYDITDRAGHEKIPEGYQRGQTLGSYVHLHLGSQPGVAEHFVAVCLKYRNQL
ncbi:MAG: cobyrinic acid a,c-diamide synthase [Desulfobacteraceae bacterium 4572_88]|nr:MAG: cobyrinic acid a,c-diamide synthase [Desulfobacteraceae bacterium 4572_88]